MIPSRYYVGDALEGSYLLDMFPASKDRETVTIEWRRKGRPDPDVSGWSVSNGGYAANKHGRFEPDDPGCRFTLAEAQALAPTALSKLRGELEKQHPKIGVMR